jgi:putative transcriptional regulator
MDLDETVLIQYALNILDEPDSAVVDRALATSANLRGRFYEIQEALNILPHAETPMEISPGLRERILASLEPEARFEHFNQRFAELFDLDESEARRLLTKIDHAETNEWVSVFLPGVSVLRFKGGPSAATSTCGLVSVKPNIIFPRHRHLDKECVLVLQGGARENSGHLLQPGDLLISTAGSEHTFKTLGPEPFVFAVLLQNEIKWLILPSLLDWILDKFRFISRS